MVKNNNEVIIALDIGTSKVLCLVADYDDEDNLRIIALARMNAQDSIKVILR